MYICQKCKKETPIQYFIKKLKLLVCLKCWEKIDD